MKHEASSSARLTDQRWVSHQSYWLLWSGHDAEGTWVYWVVGLELSGKYNRERSTYGSKGCLQRMIILIILTARAAVHRVTKNRTQLSV